MLSSLKVLFWGSYFGSSSPWRAPKFCPNNCLTKQLPTLQVSSFYVEQFKSFILEGFAPWRTPKFGLNNCLTYNYLFQLSMSSHSKWPFFRPTFWGEPFDMELNINNMQTTPKKTTPFSPTIILLH